MVLASEAAARMHIGTEKKKGHVKMVKPGQALAPARRVAPWVASSVPRTIRNRPSRKLKPGKPSPSSPTYTQQEVVVNAVTGRLALGPWSGPFKSHPNPSGLPDVVLPDTLFMDSDGAAHLGLDTAEHNKLLRALQEAQESNGMLSNPPNMDAALRAMAQVMGPKRVQAKRKWLRESGSMPALQKAPSMRNTRVMQRRDHQINQPRRFYSSNLILRNAQHGIA